MSVRCGVQAKQTLRLKAQADLTDTNTGAAPDSAGLYRRQHACIQPAGLVL